MNLVHSKFYDLTVISHGILNLNSQYVFPVSNYIYLHIILFNASLSHYAISSMRSSTMLILFSTVFPSLATVDILIFAECCLNNLWTVRRDCGINIFMWHPVEPICIFPFY